MQHIELILAEIRTKCNKQDTKWGLQLDNTPSDWLVILTEHLGKTAQAIQYNNEKTLHDELIQVAAVAISALQRLGK